MVQTGSKTIQATILKQKMLPQAYFCVFGHEIEQQNPVLILNKSDFYFIRLRVFRISHTDLVNIMTTNELKMI